MGAASAVPPPANDPVLDASGNFTLAWRRFFEGLFFRTGKFADISFEPTSDTTVTFTYKGSDGIVRTGTVTLS